MKKTVLFLVMLITVMIAITSYIYLRYQTDLQKAKRQNESFESYYEQEIFGTDLATVINKAVDCNEKNEVEKDKNNMYVENESNSINIDIKFIDDDKVHRMEELHNAQISSFVGLYNQIKFKCTDIKYHSQTHNVKYMLFEQITS